MQQPTIHDIARLLEASIDGSSETAISGVNKIEEAGTGEITFLSNPKYAKFVATTNAACILVSTDYSPSEIVSATLLRVSDPYSAFLQVVKLFTPEQGIEPSFRHPSSAVHETAQIHASAHVAAHVSIGKGCVISANVVLHAGVVLYDGVSIGAGTTLHANTVCYQSVSIGERCIIHGGCVIGADGFGLAEQKDGSFLKIPQIGTVTIGDDVEIGANCTIDRAAMGTTRVENGVKLDNLIHVAHNVVIGEHTAIAAQAGISGSTKIGKRNRVAGQVGFVGHISTSDDVIVYAQSGVAKSIAHKGVYFGSPAIAVVDELKQQAALKQLPELLAEVRRLKQELEILKMEISKTQE